MQLASTLAAANTGWPSVQSGTSSPCDASIVLRPMEYAAWLFNPRGWVTAIQRELQAVVGDSRIAFTNQPWFVASCLAAIAAAIIGILGLLMASRSGNVLRLVLSETMRPVALSRQPIADLGGSRRQQPSRLLST